MDKFSKSVFKFLLSQPGYGFNTLMYDPPGFDKPAFIRACKHLAEQGLAVQTKVGYALTHAGIHKAELDRIAFWRSFLTRFLPGLGSGIAVGFISGLLLQLLSQPPIQ